MPQNFLLCTKKNRLAGKSKGGGGKSYDMEQLWDFIFIF